MRELQIQNKMALEHQEALFSLYSPIDLAVPCFSSFEDVNKINTNNN